MMPAEWGGLDARVVVSGASPLANAGHELYPTPGPSFDR